MLTRRESLSLVAGAAAIPVLSVLGSCSPEAPQASAIPALPPDQRWLTKLTEGLPEELDYVAEVEGRLPNGLSGTLYRNGPGLFERDGFRKWTILDGDGMIRATTFADGRARFRNRFVRTVKYNAEEKAGTYQYPTWTTPAPGFFENIPCIPSRSQAGVTPVVKAGRLYAFDEVGTPWALDPASLDTERALDPYEGEGAYEDRWAERRVGSRWPAGTDESRAACRSEKPFGPADKARRSREPPRLSLFPRFLLG